MSSIPCLAAADDSVSDEWVPGLRLSIATTFIGYFVYAVYAAVMRHGLFADGAYVMVKMLETERVTAFQTSRQLSHMLHQFPTVLAIWLGIKDLYALTTIYGLTLHLLPLVVTLSCYFVLPRQEKAFFIFPFLHFLAGTMASAFAPIGEAPIAAAIFWLLLCLTLFGAESGIQKALLFACSVLSLFLHEVYSFLALVLLVACVYRARGEERSSTRYGFIGLAGWFAVVSATQVWYAMNPADPRNRDGFLTEFLQLAWLHSGTVVNAPAALGLLALAVAGLSWLAYRRNAEIPKAVRAALLVVVGVAAALPVLLAIYSDHFVVPASHFSARNQSAFVSFILAGVVAITLRKRRDSREWLSLAPTKVLTIVAIGSLGWLLVATTYWGRYIGEMNFVLSQRTGLIEWEQARSLVSEPNRRIFSRFGWGWAVPSASILLAPGGKVSTIIDSRPGVAWIPFEPRYPEQLPRSRLLTTEEYVRALRAQ